MDPKGRLSSQIHFLVPLGITYSDSLHCGNTLDQIYQKQEEPIMVDNEEAR